MSTLPDLAIAIDKQKRGIADLGPDSERISPSDLGMHLQPGDRVDLTVSQPPTAEDLGSASYDSDVWSESWNRSAVRTPEELNGAETSPRLRKFSTSPRILLIRSWWREI